MALRQFGLDLLCRDDGCQPLRVRPHQRVVVAEEVVAYAVGFAQDAEGEVHVRPGEAAPLRHVRSEAVAVVRGVGVPFAALEGVAVADVLEAVLPADVSKRVVVVLVDDGAVFVDDLLDTADRIAEVVVECGLAVLVVVDEADALVQLGEDPVDAVVVGRLESRRVDESRGSVAEVVGCSAQPRPPAGGGVYNSYSRDLVRNNRLNARLLASRWKHARTLILDEATNARVDSASQEMSKLLFANKDI